MTKSERLRINLITVYRSIKAGASTIDDLLEATKIGQYHLRKALNVLKELEIIDEGTEDSHKQHRHTKIFSITNKYHTTYMERHEPNFLFVSISSMKKCITTAGFPVRYSVLSPTNTFDFFTRAMKRNKIYKYCNKIYLLSDNTNDIKEQENIVRISRLDLIATSLSFNEESLILNFYGTKYLVYDGTYTLLDSNDNNNIEQIEINDENIYDQIYEALARHTDIYIENILNNY